jgi:FkbM family methyltransferase
MASNALGKLVGRFNEIRREKGFGFVLGRTAAFINRLYRQATFKPYVIEKSYHGARFSFLINDIWGEDWYTYSEEQKPEIGWLEANIHAGERVADCGAHHGLMTLLFRNWVGESGNVLAIEALPANAEVVRKNVKLNGYSNVVVKNVAVGSKNGTLHFANSKFAIIKDSNGRVTDDKSRSIEVPVVTLDSLYPEAPPTVVKIDVEGHEIEVLRGASKIMQSLPKLAIEIHCEFFDDPIAKVRELFSLIPMEKYESFIQLDIDGPIAAFDPKLHSPEQLAPHPNVHLFSRLRFR